MKRIAIPVVIAVGLAAIAAFAVPLLVSPDLLKQRIVEGISTATGRVVTLAGAPRLSIYPHLSVTIDRLTIANPKGMGDDPFVVADKVTARIRFLPLLTGHMELAAFELMRPRVHLITEGDGRSNWEVARNAAGGGPATANAALGQIKIDNGTVIYDDLTNKRHEELSDVDLDLMWNTAEAAGSGNGRLQWRGEAVKFNGAIANLVDFLAGRGSAVRFALASTPLRFSFNGSVLGMGRADLEGDATVSTPSLRKVVEWLGTPLGNGSILGPASVEGRLSWHKSDLSFSKASFSLDGNEAQGVVSVKFGGARPAVQGTFAATKLDLSPYFEAVSADASANGPWLFAAARLPIASLVDCDLRLSANEALIGTVRLAGFGATGTIKDGAVAVNIGEAQVYGGKLDATVIARMEGDRLTTHVRAAIDGALVQGPLKELLNIEALSGKANASIDVNGSGATWGELALSAAGGISITVADGTLAGIDMKEIAARMVDPLAEPMPPSEGSAAFDKLAGTLVIANSIVSTSDLTFEGQDYTAALSGRGSLLTGSVEANATLAMKADPSKTIPLTVSGTWRAPLIGPRQLSLQGSSAVQPPG